MSRQQRDGRERVVEQRSQQGVEAVGVGERVGFAFVEVEAGAPEFGVGAFDDDAAGFVGPDGGLDVAEGGDDGLGEGCCEAVFGGLAHCYYVHAGRGRGDGEVFESWGRHDGIGGG